MAIIPEPYKEFRRRPAHPFYNLLVRVMSLRLRLGLADMFIHKRVKRIEILDREGGDIRPYGSSAATSKREERPAGGEGALADPLQMSIERVGGSSLSADGAERIGLSVSI